MDFQSLAPVGNYSCFDLKKKLKNSLFLKTGITTKPQHLRFLKSIRTAFLTPERRTELRLSHMSATFGAHAGFYAIKDLKNLRGIFTAQS